MDTNLDKGRSARFGSYPKNRVDLCCGFNREDCISTVHAEHLSGKNVSAPKKSWSVAEAYVLNPVGRAFDDVVCVES